jgi:hypothetical protein
VTGDIFEEHPLGADFADDPGNVGPEVPLVVGALALSCGAERLAGIPGEDSVKGSAKWPSVECGNIVPDGGWCEIPCPLGRDDGVSRVGLPFDEGAGVISGLGEHEAHIQASAACAEGQSVPGT